MADPTVLKSTTQTYLDIHDITQDIVIMKDGSAAMVLNVDAINFALLAEAEQDAIIYSYAGLLNSLNYPVQILIRSQTKDVSNYLSLLEEQEINATSQLKKNQIQEYRTFVSNLIHERHVLDKKFYVVIPASALELGLVSAQSVIPGVKTTNIISFEPSILVEKAHNNLDPKRDHLIGQFARLGLYARQLNTQEVIQLFYVTYNPEAAEGLKITDSRNYTTTVVEAQMQNIPSFDPTPNFVPAPPVAEPVAPAPVSVPPTPPMPTAPTPPVVAPEMPAAPVMPTPPTPQPITPAPMSIPPTPPMPAAPLPPTQAAPAPNPMAPAASAAPVDLQAAIDATLQNIKPSEITPPAATNAADPAALPPLPEI
jgi:hypothetical protein